MNIRKNVLEFEVEIKKRELNLIQEFLILNSLKDFEYMLSKHFYRRSKILLTLDLLTAW